MPERIDCDLCVIGAGSAGLSPAAGASLMGARTVLIERAHMGGDCLNFGCVPSKALLAAAKAAAAPERARRMGVELGPARVDFAKVNDHVRAVIAAIAPQDSVARYRGLGITVILAEARFVGPRDIAAGPHHVRAKRIVIATGSAPAVPPIPGLDRVPYFTNETVFANRTLPEHLIVIGGGPIGMELAQAHRRLGARVTVLEGAKAMGKDDAELAALLLRALRREGVAIEEGAKVERVDREGDGVAVQLAGGTRIAGSHLLVATGRKPNVAGMNLETAGVEYSPKGIDVDTRLRTSNSRIYAIGDVAGGLQFTHVAGWHAGIALRNALFRWPARAAAPVPWVTYTDPELAHVGLTEAQARADYERVHILRWPFSENDRAQAEGATEGLVKIVATHRGRVLGASILGQHAGELILPWVLAIAHKLKVGALAAAIAPYPTLSEASKRAAASWYTPLLFSERTRRLVRLLLRFA